MPAYANPDHPMPGEISSGPIIMQSNAGYFQVEHTADATRWGYPTNSGEEYGKEIFYQVTLPERMSMIVHTYGSELMCTDVQVYGPGYGTIYRAHHKNDYLEYYSSVHGTEDSICSISQDCFIAFDCPPGVYDIRSRGYRYYNGNIVNGPIRTTIIGFSEDAPIYRDIPEHYIPGTIGHPFPLGRYWGEFSFTVDTCYSDRFFSLRGGRSVAYYEFSTERELNLTIDATRFKGLLEVTGDSATIGFVDDKPITTKFPPGHYLIAAHFNDTLAINFTIAGELPPEPIPEGEYEPISICDKSIIGKNFVSTKTMLDASGQNYAESVSHVDGLGRPVQEILVDATADGLSIVTHQEYDSSGRGYRTWLPTAASSQSDINHYSYPSVLDYTGVYENDTHPYATTVYESSPISRVIKQYNPGDKWYNADVSVNTEYLLNCDSGEMSCICFTVTDTPDNPGLPIMVSCSTENGGTINYGAGELTITKITDEDGNSTYTFKDSYDRTILSRRTLNGAFVDTYYIYDVYGNLTVVLPPEASAQISGSTTLVSGQSELLDSYAYVYSYDCRGRVTSKRLPGAEKIEYCYDDTDRCVLWRDGNTRRAGQWHFDIADAYGRPCISGLCSDILVSPRVYHQLNTIVRAERSAAATNTLMGYAVTGLNLSQPQVLVANYYDDYSFLGQYGIPDNAVLGFDDNPDYGARYENVKGRNTGTVIAIPTYADSDSLQYLYTAHYYDSRDREIQTVATNHLGGTDRELIRYDFAGRPIKTEAIHSRSLPVDSTAIVQQWERTFDKFNRELTVRHRLGRSGEWMTISDKSYDAVGRLSEYKRGSYDSPSESYGYDIRSRLTSITGYFYRQHLSYTLGGNVSRQSWWSYRPSSVEQTYDYEYDELSRLTAAYYTDAEGNAGLYDTSYVYDLNGNITSLSRSGLYNRTQYDSQYGLIDDLTFEYSGNQMQSVSDFCSGPFYRGAYHFVDGSDESVEYSYDANGNTVTDLNRGITATMWDWNNRPKRIYFSDGSQTQYLYDATGEKHRTIHRVAPVPMTIPEVDTESPNLITSITDYCGDIVYEDSILSRINFEGGYLSYVDYSGSRISTPEYHFYISDHLGNNRMDVTDMGSVWQAMDYYPYGLPMGSSYLPDKQRWLFGGKELDRVSGLDLSDFAARFYDPATGRFRSPDPHLESYLDISPVVFGLNNPMIYADPTGKDAIVTIENKTITIRADVILTGKYATEDLAKIYLEDIKNTWGKITEYSHGDEIYSVVWDVNVRVISDGEKINYDGKNNYMEVLNSSETSKVIETNHGKIRSKGTGGRDLKNDNPMSHEFGHFLGLKDKYIKSEDGKYSYIIPEWKGDIMAEPCYKTDRKISQYTLMHLLLNPIKYHQDRSRFVNFWTSLFNINYQISTTYKINKYNRQK